MKDTVKKQIRKAVDAKGGKRLAESVKKLEKAAKDGGYGATLL